jgi:hypothetical protein
MNKIKVSWSLHCEELNCIDSNDIEIVQDQILYSVNRQLRELEEIYKQAGAMIEELKHVQNFVRGMG